MKSITALLLFSSTAIVAAFTSSTRLAFTTLSQGIANRPLPRASSSTTRIFQTIQEQEDKYLDLAVNSDVKPDLVYIIMYNPGTVEEGVHNTEYPKGSGKDVLLAFESIEDCSSFANSLRADPEFKLEPVPTPAPFAQMEISCQQMDLPIQVVPASSS